MINYWIESSDRDFETMIHLYEKKEYHWSLFIGHLVIKRLLKALIVKIQMVMHTALMIYEDWQSYPIS
ncbi:HEPN domain-containing protein [Membranihabitans maritimus]|uniref:HEPN domain-containing protein n=1 Tax=Membranihabitans maritimus TaxID=2904244 RepID=UPI0034E2A9EA